MKTSAELETQAALHVASLMTAAARTAPKTRGIDYIKVFAVDDAETKQKIIDKMKEIGERENRSFMVRDADNIAASPVLVVIGAVSNPVDLNCGYCGHPSCEALAGYGGICAFNSIDLGIAACSAAAVASRFHIDNRMMYSIGTACLELKMFEDSVKQALGIPLSVTGKNPYFDRKA
jgi:uncharacterized ferredoxin-like protein